MNYLTCKFLLICTQAWITSWVYFITVLYCIITHYYYVLIAYYDVLFVFMYLLLVLCCQQCAQRKSTNKQSWVDPFVDRQKDNLQLWRLINDSLNSSIVRISYLSLSHWIMNKISGGLWCWSDHFGLYKLWRPFVFPVLLIFHNQNN